MRILSFQLVKTSKKNFIMAAKVKTKGNYIGKTKLKKTLKNLVSRPDEPLWPTTDAINEEALKEALEGHKVTLPEFTKLHWSILSKIPKSERPKLEKQRKPEGFIFGISHTARALQNGECAAVLIDKAVSPRIMVEHILEGCRKKSVPVLCLAELKKVTYECFGFSTCVLSLRKEHFNVQDIVSLILKYGFTNLELPADSDKKVQNINAELGEKVCQSTNDSSKINKVDVTKETSVNSTTSVEKLVDNCLKPASPAEHKPEEKQFSGQDFISLTDKPKTQNNHQKKYKSMIVKRITNNPNRKKKK